MNLFLGAEPSESIVMTDGSKTTDVASVPILIVLAVLLATETERISLKEIVPFAVPELTPFIVSVL